jgi:hypothetical protein
MVSVAESNSGCREVLSVEPLDFSLFHIPYSIFLFHSNTVLAYLTEYAVK